MDACLRATHRQADERGLFPWRIGMRADTLFGNSGDTEPRNPCPRNFLFGEIPLCPPSIKGEINVFNLANQRFQAWFKVQGFRFKVPSSRFKVGKDWVPRPNRGMARRASLRAGRNEIYCFSLHSAGSLHACSWLVLDFTRRWLYACKRRHSLARMDHSPKGSTCRSRKQ